MTAPQKGRIFISYRRTDSAGYAGRIYDRLTAQFGEDAVFMDVDTIEAGLDFVEVLQNAVQSCDVLVALIGRSWLNIKDATGKRRLDNPEDFVRIEVAAALNRDIRVIPVLVDGAPMPRSTELPENLKPLARRNALQVDHHSFNADAQRLIAQLELALKAAEDSRILKARRLQEEQERKEKEAREAEERKRVEKKEQEERARLAAAQKAQKEREDRERHDAEEKTQKEKEERERKIPPATPVSRTVSPTYPSEPGKPAGKPAWLPYGIGGGVILACAILFGLGYLIQNALTPDSPTATNRPQLQATETDTPQPPEPVVTEQSATSPANAPPANPSIGSTWVQTKDGMAMVYVPAGEFQMGSDADDALAVCQKFSTTCQRDWFTAEEPIHTVDLNAFWIDQTEITNAMYARCVDAGVCEPPTDNSSYNRDSYYGNSEYNDYPVIYVSWDQAKTYCEWAGRRLPTEAEWEKAAGWDEDAQAQRMYPWGDAFNGNVVNFCDVNCNIRKNADYDDGYEDTSPVGSYPSGGSYYGTYDMAGNVWEWVSDWYDVYPGGDKNVSEYFGQTYRLLRGGGWSSSASFVRTACRSRSDPTNSGPEVDLGFRCSRDASP